MSVDVRHGDCREVIKSLADCSINSCVTDPPYSLVSIQKRFGKPGQAPAKFGKDGLYQRASSGFMGQQWDTGETAHDPAFWAEVLRVLKPGGHVIALCGTRTYHRLACAIEDAGFEIRDAILWLYGSGFPKSHDVSKGIDRRGGASIGWFGPWLRQERERRGISQKSLAVHFPSKTGRLTGCVANWELGLNLPTSDQFNLLCQILALPFDRIEEAEREVIGRDDRPAGWFTAKDGHDITSPATDAARQWSGWGTALKPACEIACLARKPLSESTIAANVLRWGCGALNINGCRIGTEQTETIRSGHSGDNGICGSDSRVFARTNPPGRWPANLCHDGSEEVIDAFPFSAGQLADASSSSSRKTQNVYGDMKRGNGREGEATADKRYTEDGSTNFAALPGARRGDVGSAARFFYQAAKDVTCPLCSADIVPKASKIIGTPTENSARSDAPDLLPRASEDSGRQRSKSAKSAAKHSEGCPPAKGDSVPSSAPTWPLEKIVRNVLGAASLCNSCATDIARALVEVRQSGSEALSRFKPSMSDSRRTILSRSLASYVASRESTDTILTTTSLKELFGSVFHAIGDCTNSERSAANTRFDSKRLFYSSKADAADRLQSKHPTVKPVDLMRWLTRLVTPPHGVVLDPFAGTGTTGMACMAEGFDCILIEREAQYIADIKNRIAHVSGENGPLFAGLGQPAQSHPPRCQNPKAGGKRPQGLPPQAQHDHRQEPRHGRCGSSTGAEHVGLGQGCGR